MEYIVAGYNMLTDIFYADGRKLENTPGGSFYSASGVKYWRDSLSYIGTAGPDFERWYGEWFRRNAIDCRVTPCLPKTLKYTLTYRSDGIWTEACSYGEEYERMAKDIGRLTPEMFAEAAGENCRGIYIEASLSAKIADDFPRIKALIPDALLMWEINGDDLRNGASHTAIEERIAQVDAFSLNFDEAVGFFATEDKTAILRGIAAFRKPCFFRQGELGAGIICGDVSVFAPAVGVGQSVDPTGCGNCSTAAAMVALSEKREYEEAVAMANLAAAACAAQFGPFPCVNEESRAEAEKNLTAFRAKANYVYGRLL